MLTSATKKRRDTIPLPTVERLRELFLYNPSTGIFTRRVAVGRHGRHRAGSVVGCLRPDGYLCIRVDGNLYLSHRLAWLYVYGVAPNPHVDHVDSVKTNNRISNLREATKSQNGANRGPDSDNTTGFKGVTFDRARSLFVAQICVRGRHFFLGRHETAVKAHAAYLAAARKHFGDFAFKERS